MRIVSVGFGSRELSALRNFWAGALGQPVRAADAGFVVTLGWSELHVRPAGADERPVHHLAIQIPGNRLDEALAWLYQRAEPLVRDGSPVIAFPNWDAHSLYFLDPAGHVLELIAHHGLPTASEAPFGPASLLGLAEVGLPGDVRAQAAAIAGAIGERVWTGGGPGFAAVGDAWGRFILVPEGHRWLPTDVPAGAFPTEVVVAGARPGEVTLGRYSIRSVA